MSTCAVFLPVIYPVVFPAAQAAGAGLAAGSGVAFSAGSGAATTATAVIGTSLAGVVGFAATAIVLPLAAKLLIDTMTDALVAGGVHSSERCVARKQQAAAHLKNQLKHGLGAVRERISLHDLLPAGREMLAAEHAKADALLEDLLGKVEADTLTRDELQQFHATLATLTEHLGHEEGRFQELQRLYQHYETKVTEQTTALSPAAQAPLKTELDRIVSLDASRIEEKLDAIAGLLSRLRAAAEQQEQNAETERRLRICQEAEYYFERISREAPDLVTPELQKLFERLTTTVFPDKVAGIRDELVLTFQRFQERSHLSAFFREKLSALQAVIPTDQPLSRRLEKTLKQAIIPRDLFQDLDRESAEWLAQDLERRKHALIDANVKKNLAALDYVVLDPTLEESLTERLARGEIVLLDTKYDEYKLLLKVAPDESLILRLIKVVAQEAEKHNISEFQKQKDTELMKEWCQNLDVFLEGLQAAGIHAAERLRVEDKVDYLTIEQLDQQKIDTNRLKWSRKSPGGGTATPAQSQKSTSKPPAA
jgi:hypothetical protein